MLDKLFFVKIVLLTTLEDMDSYTDIFKLIAPAKVVGPWQRLLLLWTIGPVADFSSDKKAVKKYLKIRRSFSTINLNKYKKSILFLKDYGI